MGMPVGEYGFMEFAIGLSHFKSVNESENESETVWW